MFKSENTISKDNIKTKSTIIIKSLVVDFVFALPCLSSHTLPEITIHHHRQTVSSAETAKYKNEISWSLVKYIQNVSLFKKKHFQFNLKAGI